MIGIVILNYSTYQDTIRLVDELQFQTFVNQMQIVVVDNSSPNCSYERLRPLEKEYTNVIVLQTKSNLGYAKGNNFGLKYLEENYSVEYVVILNNDVILPNDCFERLVNRYLELDRPAVITPVMTNERGVPQEIMGDLGSTWDDFKILFALYNKLSKSKFSNVVDNTGDKAMRVEVINGSFMFVKFSIFKEMGFFYPNTFLYVEERFVAEAAKRLGYNNYVILDQEYIHAHNSPTISSCFNQVSRYKMLYKSRLEYTRVCKKNGKIKAAFLMPFMAYSLFEWMVIGWCKSK